MSQATQFDATAEAAAVTASWEEHKSRVESGELRDLGNLPLAARNSQLATARPNPLCAFETACGNCGETAFVDTPIHGGRSTRRDCKACNRTLGFPHWYDLEPASLPPVDGVYKLPAKPARKRKAK
jgi:hypothetical protein